MKPEGLPVLYAFDGTWNDNKEGNDRDANVLWFREAYLRAAKISDNAARMKPGGRPSKGPWYDLIKQPYRTVRWNDDIHASVTFDEEHDSNNPPDGADLVDDDGPAGNKFKRA